MDIFSNRNTPLPDVFIYDKVPAKLKGQLEHIVGELCDLAPASTIEDIYLFLLREWGMQDRRGYSQSAGDVLQEYVVSNSFSAEYTLDILEVLFRHLSDRFEQGWPEGKQRLVEIIEEVNNKFRRAGFGYEYADEMFIAVNSQLAHKEIVLPALQLLSDPAYSAADGEYRSAHEHFRHRRYAECLVECCKAFESVMKVICTDKGWQFQPTDAASRVLKVLEANGLFPAYMGNQLNHLLGLLEGTVPTVRNKLGGHGAGRNPVVVPEEYAAFALHSTAADILLLTKLAK